MGLPAVVVMKNPNERLAFSVSVRRGEQRWAGHASAIAILTKAATPTLVDCRKVSRRGKWQFFRARFYRSTKIRFSLILPLRESCWGVPSPNPAYAACAAEKPLKIFFGFFKNSSASHPVFLLLVRGHHAQKGGQPPMKRYNTPHRSRVVKTRMTEEEYAEFAQRLSAYHMSQAEFIRQAITGAAIRPTITVSPVNDELLAAVGKLTAEYGRIGGNLNQIARTLNEWHSPYPQLAGEVRAAVSDLAALKFEVLQKVGDAVGNIQTYQL